MKVLMTFNKASTNSSHSSRLFVIDPLNLHKDLLIGNYEEVRRRTEELAIRILQKGEGRVGWRYNRILNQNSASVANRFIIP